MKESIVIFVISGELHKPKTAPKFRQTFKDIGEKLKFFRPNHPLMRKILSEGKPPFVLLHNMNGQTKAFQKKIDEYSPKSMIIHCSEDLSAAKCLIQKKLQPISAEKILQQLPSVTTA